MGIVDDYYGGYETLAMYTDGNGNVDFEGAYYDALDPNFLNMTNPPRQAGSRNRRRNRARKAKVQKAQDDKAQDDKTTTDQPNEEDKEKSQE